MIRKTLLPILALVVLAQSAALCDDLEPRPRIPLEGSWEMRLVRELDDEPGEKWSRMNLPGRRTLPKDKVPEPGKRNEAGDDAPADDSKTRRGMWVRRTVEIPAGWEGRRIVWRIGKVVFAATAYVNGEKVGDIPGYGASLDITKYVNVGEENELRLFFGEYGSGVARLDEVTKVIVARLRQQAARGGWDWGSRYVGVICEPEFFYVESQNPDVAIEDVWYRTYTRGYPRIVPLVTVRSRTALEGLSARLVVAEKATGKVVRDKTFPVGRLAVGEATLDLPVRADDLALWDIRKPNLYVGQVMLLDGEGNRIDRSAPTVFGVREFYTQGRKWFLNGHPVHFSFSWAGRDRKSIKAKVDRGVTLFASTIARPGAYITRVHIEPVPVQHKICDELGVGLTYLGCEDRWLDMTDPAIVRDYRTWVREHLERVRNHPSIIMYCIGMNTPGNYLDFSPTTIGRLDNIDTTNIPAALAMTAHHEADPTRLTYFHGGPAGGDVATGNIYFNHKPTQEIEDWLSRWAERGDRPVLAVEFFGAPLGVDFLLSTHKEELRRSFITEYAAMLAGERAYDAEIEAQRRYEHNVVPRGGSYWGYRPHWYNSLIVEQIVESHSRASRSWRFEGVPQYSWGWSLYKNMEDAPEAIRPALEKIERMDRELLKPDMAWIGGPEGRRTSKAHNVYAGETVEKSAVVIHDSANRARWRIRWTVTDPATEETLAEGGEQRTIVPFARKQYPIRFEAPAVTEKTDLALTLTVTDADSNNEVATDTFRLTAWPRRDTTAAPGAIVHIIDPEGDTTRWLNEMGVKTIPVEKADDATKVLVIGRRGLGRFEETMPFTPEQVAKGLRVVIFEQHCDALGKFGFRHEDRSPRKAFARMEHPLTAALDNEALRDWRGSATLIPPGPGGDRQPLTRRLYRWGNRGVVVSNIIETPHRGPFLAPIDCGFDLAYSPLVRWGHGRGEVIFCQLDLTGRIGLEPAADLVAHNLIAYLTKPNPNVQLDQSREAVCFDRAVRDRIEALGFKALMHDEARRRGELVNPLWVIAGDDPEGLMKHREALAFGGDVLVLYADEALLNDELFGGVLSAERKTFERGGRAVTDHPLLRGLGPQDVRFREPLSFNALASERDDVTVLLNGLAAVYRRGDTRFVLLQTDPSALEDYGAVEATVADDKEPKQIDRDWRRLNRRRTKWHIDRLHSVLLANLGVQSSEALVKRLFEVKRQIPLRPVNKWVYLGPIPTDPKREDPLDIDATPWLKHRDLNWKGENARGEIVSWTVPTDSQNGMGIGGRMDLARVYGVRVKDVALAVTQIWSSRAREASVLYGGDWWVRLIVNGKNIEGGGAGFERKGTIPLKRGWNDVVAVVAAGSNGHWFQFHLTDPGDVRVVQRTTPPEERPENLPPLDRLLPEQFEPGFSFYTEPMREEDDPYKFIPW